MKEILDQNINFIILITVLTTIVALLILVYRLRSELRRSNHAMEEIFFSNRYLYRFFNETEFRNFFLSFSESNRLYKDINFTLKRLERTAILPDETTTYGRDREFIDKKLTYIASISSNIVHSIGTPLAAMKLHLEDKEIDSELLKSNLELIQNNVEGFANLYKNLEADYDVIGINQKITTTCHVLKLASEKKVNVDFKIDQNIQFSRQTFQVYQIPFCCLFENAIDAIRDNGKIQINIRSTDKYLYTSIYNSGKPIKESKETLFSRGFSTKKSNGFGLAMANEIIKNHFNSELNFENQNDGVMFEFTISL